MSEGREDGRLWPRSTDEAHGMSFDRAPDNLDEVVRDIMHEIAEERAHGKVRPFAEGEPIGIIPRRVDRADVTDADVAEYRARHQEWERGEMLALRRANDRLMGDLLR